MLRYCWGMYDYRFLKGFAWSHSLSCLAKGIILPLKTVPIRRVNSWFFKRVRHLATRGYLWGGQLQVGFSEPACWDCYLAQHRAAVKARWASYQLEDGKTTDKDQASMTLLVKLAKWRFWNSFCSVCYIYFDFHKLKMTKFLKNTQNALIHGKESLQEKEKGKKKKAMKPNLKIWLGCNYPLETQFCRHPTSKMSKAQHDAVIETCLPSIHLTALYFTWTCSSCQAKKNLIISFSTPEPFQFSK